MKRDPTRRQFLTETAAIAAAVATAGTGGPARATAAISRPLPMIHLGNLQVSRVFLGSNPFFGFSHGNPQAGGKEMREWYTDERIMAVLDEAAELGINAVWTPCYDRWLQVWNAYRDKGGKLKIWVAQPDRQPMEDEIMKAVRNGSQAICVQGCNIDGQVKKGRWDVVRGWLELIKSHDLPAGMATHGSNTHLEAEEKGLPTDFYHQTMYRPDNYVRTGLEQSLATIDKLDKPVVGYKVLGAGRLRPQDTLPYVFSRLKRKDGICVGVFPKKNRNEIKENVAVTRQCTGETTT
jgi:hypothetical protein